VKRRASIEKARKILGYEPRIDIRTGLKKVYEWISGNKSKIEQVAGF
jgi:nucleoside-diphosphate-sugar epimerase